jgi:predicted dehydrogenase
VKNPASPSPSRREFIGRSAAAAAGMTLGGACASNSSKASAPIRMPIPIARERAPLGPGDPIRMGVIGTGGMGNEHINSTLTQITEGIVNLQIVALADVCKPRLDATLEKVRAGQTGVEVSAYRNYQDLLARDDIHCVLIASPEHWHRQHAEDAIAAGKDVYVEKPMTLRLPDALRLREVMQANPGMRMQVGTQFLTHEKYEAARKLIAAGEIGHCVSSQTSYCRNTPDGEWNYYGIDPTVQPGEMLDWEAWCGPLGPREFDTKIYHRWRRYRDFSTGIVGDLLVHVMTPLVYAINAGWPTKVAAIGGHYMDHDMENHDQVNLTIQFEKDHTMVVAGSTLNQLGTETLIRGNKANIYLNSANCVVRPEPPFEDEVDPQDIPCDSLNDQPKLRLDFWNAVRTREQNLSQVEFATKVMVIVDLATRAMWDGRTYEFDPATMRVASA